MALTRKLLKGMGLTEEQVDTIVEAHTETVDGLKEQIAGLSVNAKEVTDLQEQLRVAKEKLAEASSSDNDYKTKYEQEHKALEKIRNEQTEREIKEKRENAAKEYFKSKGISDANLNLAMRSSVNEIASLEFGDDGNVVSTESLDGLIAGDLKGLIVSTNVQGANTPNPPQNNGLKYTRDDIRKMSPEEINKNYEAIKQSLKGE